jgi:hypothetical protein
MPAEMREDAASADEAGFEVGSPVGLGSVGRGALRAGEHLVVIGAVVMMRRDLG